MDIEVESIEWAIETNDYPVATLCDHGRSYHGESFTEQRCLSPEFALVTEPSTVVVERSNFFTVEIWYRIHGALPRGIGSVLDYVVVEFSVALFDARKSLTMAEAPE